PMTATASRIAHSGPVPADMGPLIGRVREFVARRREMASSFEAPHELADLVRRFDLAPPGRGRPEVVLAQDTAVELGHPRTESVSAVLVTTQSGLIAPGRITIVGPDLDELNSPPPLSFGQVVMLAVGPGVGPDPYAVEAARYLTHRLPGFMVRSVPGRLWVRISRRARAGGLDLAVVGSALIAVYGREVAGVTAGEVVFVTSSAGDVADLGPIAAEGEILAGRHRKLVLRGDGTAECPDLDCDRCESKAVCDRLRDVIIRRRGRRP
ncbi:MAG: hypothetical protein KJ621_16890, partial [Proteobacteria bacterium]|nr:hypothetical protein [Pseudomonadota bacterium]